MEGLDFGEAVYSHLELSGPPAALSDSSGVRVITRLGTGDMILVDLNADPSQVGSSRGAFFLVRSSDGKTDLVQPSNPRWVDPTAIEGFDEERVLLADPMGVAPGQIYLVDYLRGTTTSYISDSRLGNPSDLLRMSTGDLLIVDPQATLTPQTPPTPVVFVQRAGSQTLSIFTQGPQLVQPPQVCEDEEGRIWLIDRAADPNMGAAGRGGVVPPRSAHGSGHRYPAVPRVFRADGSDGMGRPRVDRGRQPRRHRPERRRRRLPRRSGSEHARRSWSPTAVSSSPAMPRSRPAATSGSSIGSRATLRCRAILTCCSATTPRRGSSMPSHCPPRTVTPAELYAFPSPAPRFLAYGYEDLNGPPLQPGDKLLFRARVGNVSAKPTMGAAYQDSLPIWAVLDPATIRFDTGSVQIAEGRSSLTWTMDLPIRAATRSPTAAGCGAYCRKART